VLTLHRTTYDATGRPIEYGAHCHIADRYTFEMSLVAAR
jgi:GntR family transcriptional regulator